MQKNIQIHTVTLDKDKCMGCVSCMKRCPTEAIRVRNGKARIHYERCISCGECVRICPHQAKKVVYDEFDIIFDPKYKYRIALPAPSLYGQFENLDNLNFLIEGLLKVGFDDVYEVARGAELVSEATRLMFERDNLKKPVISTACPAVLQLILLRFHSLKDNLLLAQAPVDIAAKLAREQAVQKTGLQPNDIGIFFISPCPAKIHALHSHLGLENATVDGVLSAADCYFRLLNAMKQVEDPRDLSQIGVFGLSWAASGGESATLLKSKYLAADGMENVLNVLKELENGKLNDLDFIELNACIGGCVGGVLNIENPFVARAKLQDRRKYLPISKNSIAMTGKDLDFFRWECPPETQNVMQLDEDITVAMGLLERINKIEKMLPMLDCGCCGAPSCRAFAEDVALGEAKITDCHRIEVENLL